MIDPTPTEVRWIAAAIALLIILGMTMYRLRLRRTARALGDSAIFEKMIGSDPFRLPVLRLTAAGAAAVLLGLAIVAAADPARREGAAGPAVLLLDASGSMLVEDADGTRLAAQRLVASSILRALPDTPIGVVTFAGRAFSLTPPTRDRGAVEMYLAAVDPTIVTQSGSAMGAAIRQGIGLLVGGTGGGGTLLLVGDGDETEDRDAVFDATTVARQAGIRIHTIRVGSAAGGPVPAVDLSTGEATGYLFAPSGEPLISQADDGLLRAIASRTGGVSIAWDDPSLVDVIGRLASPTGTTPGRTGALPLYAWLATLVLILLALEPALERAGKKP